MKSTILWTTVLISVQFIFTGCSTVPKGTESQDVLSAEVKEAIAVFKTEDPTIQSFFDNSYGYAVCLR